MSMTCLAVGAAIVLAWPKQHSVAGRTRSTVAERPAAEHAVAPVTIKNSFPLVAAALRLAPERSEPSQRVAAVGPQLSPKAARESSELSEAPRAAPAAVDGPKPRPVGFAAGLREAAVAKPFDRPEPPEPRAPAACKDGKCGSPKESSAPSGQYGTTLTFAENRYAAEKEAKESGKLLLLLNISGNFEESKFT
jgi:hypothetical protein